MQALGRELEVKALEVEINGLDLEIDVSTDPLVIDSLQAQRAELQIRLETIKEDT